MNTTHSPAYAFEDRVDEHRRLIEQSILFDPIGRKVVQQHRKAR